jgi:plasmid stabilization system protein ParE
MTHALRFQPEVEADVRGGRAWYEGKSRGLGDEFLRVFYASCQELTRSPRMYPQTHRDFHRCLLRRFPYAIYFTIEEDIVVVFGLFHCARDPRRRHEALRNRK